MIQPIFLFGLIFQFEFFYLTKYFDSIKLKIPPNFSIPPFFLFNNYFHLSQFWFSDSTQFYGLSQFFGLSWFLDIESVFRLEFFLSVLIWRFDEFFHSTIFTYLPCWLCWLSFKIWSPFRSLFFNWISFLIDQIFQISQIFRLSIFYFSIFCFALALGFDLIVR